MVLEIVDKYDTESPEEIINYSGIKVIGLSPDSQEKSFSLKSYDKDIIVINPSLKDDEYNYRLAHELGHIFIHFNKCNHAHSFGKNHYQETLDAEANYFADNLFSLSPITV